MEAEENKNDNVDMTGAENQENNTSTEVVSNADSVQEQPNNADLALAYLRENGIEVNSIDELKKQSEKVVEKVEVNPYEDVLDDDDKAYLNYKKETGRSRKEYEALNSNLDDLPRIELARERVRKETGLKLSNEQVDEYIAESLGIDLEDMSTSDQVKLASYTKSILDEKKAEQEKYRTPKEKQNENSTQKEYVELPNGGVILKSQLEELEKTRQQNILKAKEAVNSVTNSDFKIKFDDKGTEREINFGYEYSDEDKHSMVSIVSDVDGVIKSRYETKDGFNYKNFSEDLLWSDPKFREKAIASLLHKAIANSTEQLLKERGNVNFTNEPLQKQTKEGVKIVSVADAIRGIY
jgi:hypothetical protein